MNTSGSYTFLQSRDTSETAKLIQHVHAYPLQHMQQQKHCLLDHLVTCILVLVSNV